MTPVEVGETAEVSASISRERQKDDWRRTAYICAAVMNSAGKTYRRTIKPEELLPFDEGGPKRMTPEEREQRKREAAETLLQHKRKFWTKFRDESVAKITGE